MQQQENTPDQTSDATSEPAAPMTPEQRAAYDAAMHTDENMEKLARKLSEKKPEDKDLPDLSFSRFLKKKEKGGDQ